MNSKHESWDKLKPTKAEQCGSENGLNEYIERITNKYGFKNVPKEVFKWICYLHDNPDIIKNYSGIDYETVTFELQEWTFEELDTIIFMNGGEIDFAKYVDEISTWTDDIVKKSVYAKDLKFWSNYGTWRIPPFAINMNLIKNRPFIEVEANDSFQLIEGHTRFGLLRRFLKLGNQYLVNKHEIYLIK